MRVKATKVGFYGGSRRRIGDVFEVEDGAKGSWFEPVQSASEAPVVPKAKRGERAKARDNDPATLSEITRNEGQDQTPKGAEDLV